MNLLKRLASAFRTYNDAAYAEARAETDTARASVTLFYVAVVYPLFYVVDVLDYPALWQEFGVIRTLHAALAGLHLLLGVRRIGRARYRIAACLIAFSATLAVAFMCSRTGGFSSPYLVGLIICFLAVSTIEVFHPGELVLALSGASALYLVLNATLDNSQPRTSGIASTFFILGALFFCVVSAAALENQRRELFRVNTRLRVQNQELERARTMQRQFLSTVSHELRSPVNSVLGFVELVEQREPGLHEKSRNNLRRINESAQRLLRYINDLLDLSKVEAGRMEVHRSQFDVVPVLHEMAEAARALALRRDLTIQVDAPDRLEVCTDELRLRQILTNLTSNAVKFTESGSVVIRALGDRDELVLEVRDTGPGIAPEARNRIFEAFRQVGTSAGGTGLGLSIVLRLAQLLGGRVELESELGRGSTFRVRLAATAAHGVAA
jgi:signal transduction histidine kinase